MDLTDEQNSMKESYINGIIICSIAIKFLSTTEKQTKKEQKKAKNPKPCFTQLHYWVLQEWKCQYHHFEFHINYISQVDPF